MNGSPLEVPGRLHVSPTMFPGPLVAPHLVASQNGSTLQLISMGGETKLEKLAGQLVQTQLEHLLASQMFHDANADEPPNHLEPRHAYPPPPVRRLTDDDVAAITENALHLAGATLEMVSRMQQGRHESSEGADHADESDS